MERKSQSDHDHRKGMSAFWQKIRCFSIRFLFFLAIALLCIWFLPYKDIHIGRSSATHVSTETSSVIITTAPTSSPSPTISPTPAAQKIRVTLDAVGDVILHQAVIDGGLVNLGEDDPEYDFTPDFSYISWIIAKSDLAIANYEGTLAGPPYSGFPYFSAPDAIADALYAAGFRVVCTANNHCIDKGLDGVIRTATVFRDKGFTVIGTRSSTSDSMDSIIDVGGISVGLMNYTFETIGTTENKAINGIPIPNGADQLINSFNPSRPSSYETDLAAILSRVKALEGQGAEFICIELHWGIEYSTHSSLWQQEMAQALCDAGVDLIIGHHPHVLQEIDVLTSSVTGEQTLVYYSLGNFLGNWNFGTNGTAGKAQDGMIARITIVKNEDGVSIEKGEYIPTYVVRIRTVSPMQHYIVPVIPALADPDAFQTTTADMQASYDRINTILGDCTGTEEIPVSEAAS